MPKFLDVPVWYGSSGQELSLWQTPGSSGQLLRSAGSESSPTWSSLRVTDTSTCCAVYRISLGTGSSTASNTAEGFLYISSTTQIHSAEKLWDFLDENGFDGNYNSSTRATFCPAIGLAFSNYSAEAINAIIIAGIATYGSSSSNPRFSLLRKYYHPFTSAQMTTTQWAIHTNIPLYTFDSTPAPLYWQNFAVSDVKVS